MNERFETFTILINRISRNIRRIQNREMAAYHLRSAHISCLYYLYTMGSMTASKLCEQCEEDKATVSRALDHLEKNGYLTCETQNAKRYKSPLVLTEKGMEAGRYMTEKLYEVLAESDSGMTVEELTAFYKSLSVISSNLETIAKRKS